jgi:uncharacterized protein (TIGR03663 family)
VASTRPRPRRGSARTTSAGPPPAAPTRTALDESPLARPLTLPGVTLEAGVYVLIAAASLLLRLWRLDALPLSPAETRTALASLDITRGGQLPGEAGALVGFGGALVFALAGATDLTARLLPALIGGLAPVTMLWARSLIGRGPAVIAAALLALSPLMVDGARAVDSGAIAATVCLALGWSVFEYARARRPGWLFASAFSLALALAAGVGAVSALVALLVVGLAGLASLGERRALPEDLDAALAALAPANGHGRGPVPEAELAASPGRATVLRALAIFAGTLFVVGTGALTDLGGIGAGVFAPIGTWVTGLVATDRGPVWTAPLMLVAYEPLTLVFGVAGAVAALRGGRAVGRFLVLWALVGFTAALLSPDRAPVLLASAVAPAAVLAAIALDRCAKVLPRHAVDYLVALLVLAWGFSLVVLGFGHVTQADPIGVRYLAPWLALVVGRSNGDAVAQAAILVLPVAVLLGAAFYLWRRTPAAGRGALGLAVATLLLACAVHAGWNLAYQVAGNPFELPRTRQTSLDVRNLVRDVDQVRQVLTINRKDKILVIDESERYPLAWYLRDRDTRIESPPSPNQAMVIEPVDAKPPTGSYVGQRYRVAIDGAVSFDGVAPFWRWLVYREAPVALRGEDAMLYVRAQR